MVALNLDSLVLCGVSVLCDGTNVDLRHGASTKATRGTPEIPFSMRHPSQGYPQQPFGMTADRSKRPEDVDTDSGAGRSQGLAGVLSRSTPINTVGRTAFRWSGANGGTVLSTACLPSLSAMTAVAAGNEVSSGLLVNDSARIPPAVGNQPNQAVATRAEVGEAWCKPASRTPPASTWGHGVR